MELFVKQAGPVLNGLATGAVEPADEETLLLAVLNSCPVIRGIPTDELADEEEAVAWQASYGRTGTAAERVVIRAVRDLLSDTVRGSRNATAVSRWLVDAGVRPDPTSDGVGLQWEIATEPDHEVAVRAILAWSALQTQRPGRLRPCENDECALFLIDRSKANRARWCSMAVCGNRMKARRHYERTGAKHR